MVRGLDTFREYFRDFENQYVLIGDKPRDNSKFEIMKEAIIHRKCIKISYVDACGKAEERVVQPLQLFYKSKDWYLKAYCRLKQDFRIFKMNRILKWKVLEEHFSTLTFPEMDWNQKGYSDVILRFSKEVAYRVYDEFDLN